MNVALSEIMPATRELSYAEAIREALDIALSTDERVILMGEDIGVYGGAFQVTGDLVHKYGADRVMDTPIAELGGAGVAVGAALTGLRPIYEFQFSDFATLAMEQFVNQAAKIRYMLNRAVSVVMRFPAGTGAGAAAQHSQSLEARFGHVPALKVVQPSMPHDAKGLLLTLDLFIKKDGDHHDQTHRFHRRHWQSGTPLRTASSVQRLFHPEC